MKNQWEYITHDDQLTKLVSEFIQQNPEFANKQELVYNVIAFQFRYAAHRIKLGAYDTIQLPRIGRFIPNMPLVVEKENYYGAISRRKLQFDDKPFSKKNPRTKKNMDQRSRSKEA